MIGLRYCQHGVPLRSLNLLPSHEYYSRTLGQPMRLDSPRRRTVLYSYANWLCPVKTVKTGCRERGYFAGRYRHSRASTVWGKWSRILIPCTETGIVWNWEFGFNSRPPPGDVAGHITSCVDRKDSTMRCFTTLLLLSAITSSVLASPPSSRSTRPEPEKPSTSVRVPGSFDAPDILGKPGSSFPATSPYSISPFPEPIHPNVSWPVNPGIPSFRKTIQPGWVSQNQILSSQDCPAVYAPAPQSARGLPYDEKVIYPDFEADSRIIQIFRLKNRSAKSLAERLKIHLKASHPGHFQNPQQVQLVSVTRLNLYVGIPPLGNDNFRRRNEFLLPVFPDPGNFQLDLKLLRFPVQPGDQF